MARLPDGATQIWVDAVRITDLDSEGYVNSGAESYVTDKVIKATFTPVLVTGDDIELKAASGNLAVSGKKGDFPKYYTLAIELGAPDPLLEHLIVGGTLLNATGAAVTKPTTLTVEPIKENGVSSNTGKLPAGSYSYRLTAFNAFGETEAQAAVTATVAPAKAGEGAAFVYATGAVPTGATGYRVYGREAGYEQFIGLVRGIGKVKSTGTTKPGAAGEEVTVGLEAASVTQGIPRGTQFIIAGDTNTTKIVFTTTAAAQAGATSVKAVASEKATAGIAAGELLVGFLDTGAVTPSGHVPTADSTVGPGEGTGFQAPALGSVANPDGFSVELWGEAVLEAAQAQDLPYNWWVFPRCKGFHNMPREFSNAANLSTYEGQCFGNKNWGSGPTKDWPFDSSKVFQRARVSRSTVPAVSVLNQPAL